MQNVIQAACLSSTAGRCPAWQWMHVLRRTVTPLAVQASPLALSVLGSRW